MTDPPPPATSLHQALRINDACDTVEKEWQAGRRPRLEDCLANVPAAEQSAWLRELLPIELFHRLAKDEFVSPDEYLVRFPHVDAALIRAWFAQEVVSRRDGKAARLAVALKNIAETLAPQSTCHPGRGPRDVTAGPEITLPGYELQGELGRGGMGIVYQARQIGLGRVVALKMLRARHDAGPEELARFKAEAGAIAKLQHANIVQIYDFGEYQGQPYFSLELVKGGTLAEKIAGVPQRPRDAARLVETLARAIHQAHQAGVVHRDLKPANVLLTPNGTPKITDFGLAKQTDVDHAATASGMLLGTPQYMAPEQAAGMSTEIGPPVDIYALGAILYEMLAGRPPFQAGSLSDLLQSILQQEPTSPRLYKHDVPRDLETICLKCLQKSSAARYSTAAELADDLCRFLADQPIAARPVSALESMWRWSRRNPYIAIPSALLVSLLLIVSIGSMIAAGMFKTISDRATTNAAKAETASQLADYRGRDTRLELARSQINEARMLRRSQRAGQHSFALAKLLAARDTFDDLARLKHPIPDQDWFALRIEAACAHLVPDVIQVARWPRESLEMWMVDTDIEHERYVLFPGGGPQAELRRIGSGTLLATIPAKEGTSFTHGMFSGEGNHLVLYSSPDQQMHFWDVRDEPRHIRSEAMPEHWRMISRDGSVYVSTNRAGVSRVIRVADGEVLAETRLGMIVFGFPLHPERPWVALQAENKLLVFDYEQKQVAWERAWPHAIQNAAWSQDGRVLVTTGKLKMHWFAERTGELLNQVENFDADGVFPLPVDSAGLIGSVDWSGSLRLFDLLTGRTQLKSSVRFFDWPRSLGPEGTLGLGYEGADYVLLRPRGSRLREFGVGGTDYLALSPDGGLLAAYHEPGGGKLHHLPSGETLASLSSEWGDLPAGFEPDGGALWLYGRGAANRIALGWNEQRTALRVTSTPTTIGNGVRDVWSTDRSARRIAAPGFGQGAILYHFADPNSPPQIIQTPPQTDVRHVQLSPDGQWLVLGSHVDGKVAVYSALDGSHLRDLLPTGGGWGTFSPDGQWLAVGKFSGETELYQVKDWQRVGSLPGQKAAFSPDGKWLAVDHDVSTIAFYETASLREIGRLEIQDQVRVWPKFVTPNGAGLIAVTVEGRRLLYFDLAGLRSDLKKLNLDWNWPTTLATDHSTLPIPEVDVISAPPRTSTGNRKPLDPLRALESKLRFDVKLCRWPEVAKDLEQLSGLDSSNHFYQYHLGIVAAYLKDEALFKRTAQQFRAQFGASSDPFIRERLAKTLLLGNRWLPVNEQPPQLFAPFLAAEPVKGLEDWALLVGARHDLQTGNFGSAEERLRKAEAVNRREHRLRRFGFSVRLRSSSRARRKVPKPPTSTVWTSWPRMVAWPDPT